MSMFAEGQGTKQRLKNGHFHNNNNSNNNKNNNNNNKRRSHIRKKYYHLTTFAIKGSSREKR
jgi:hypothetical protein